MVQFEILTGQAVSRGPHKPLIIFRNLLSFVFFLGQKLAVGALSDLIVRKDQATNIIYGNKIRFIDLTEPIGAIIDQIHVYGEEDTAR